MERNVDTRNRHCGSDTFEYGRLVANGILRDVTVHEAEKGGGIQSLKGADISGLGQTLRVSSRSLVRARHYSL